MKICLDTNAYSEFKYGSQNLKRLFEEAEEIHIPAVVLGELYAGFQLGSLTESNLAELNEFLSKPGIMTADINADIALRYGYLVKDMKQRGTPIPTNDIWVAASAMETGTILISREKHFKKISGLMVMDWETHPPERIH